MNTLIVADRSGISDVLDWLRRAMPRSLFRMLFAVPEPVLLPSAARPKRGVPVCLVLAPELILRRRLTLPKRARRLLADAVRLLVDTETPFTPDELLLHAEQLKAEPGASEFTYELRMTPRATVFEAARELGIGKARIVRITDASAEERVDFWPAAFPRRRLLRWAPVVPLLAITLSGGMMSFRVLAQQQVQLAALEASVAEKLTELRAVSRSVETLRAGMTGEQAISLAFEASPSAYNALQAVRRLLPEDVQLVRVQLTPDELRLTMKASDLLGTSRALAAPEASAPWSSEIEGPITADPGTGLEQGTVLLRTLSAEETK